MIEKQNFRHGMNIDMTPKIEFDKLNISNSGLGEVGFENNSEDCIITHLSKEDMDKANAFFGQEWDSMSDNKSVLNDKAILINIKDGVKMKKPLLIQSKDFGAIRIFIHVEKNAEADIIFNSSLIQGGQERCVCDEIRVLAQKNSKTTLVSSQDFPEKIFSFRKRLSLGEEGSEVNFVDLSIGGSHDKIDVISLLKGRKAKAKQLSIYLGGNDQVFDLYNAAIHDAEETKSDIKSKGILSHKSRALSRGLIKIDEKAAESDGYEKQEALLLGEEAEANAIPNLEIKNNEVRCSHGTSIGEIDKEQVFYLMSRGLSK